MSEGDDLKVRALFIAPPGYTLVVGDYSQIELRLLAHYAGPLNRNSRLLYAYRNGIDLHLMTAMGLFGKEQDEITKEERTHGKTANFLLSFGGGPKRLVESGGYKMSLAKDIYKGFHRTYPEIRRYSDRVVNQCRAMGRSNAYVETLLGRKRRLPEICLPGFNEEQQKLRAYAERQAVNHQIQGTAADINKMAMVRTQRRIERGRHDDWHLILTVHDELVLEVPEDDAPDAEALLREAMEGVKVDLRVPLVADIHSAPRWSDAK